MWIQTVLVTVTSVIVLGIIAAKNVSADPAPGAVKALYLGTPNVFNKAKIAELERIIETTDASGIVIDVKDSSVLSLEYMRELAGRFRSKGAYTIARVVTFQDSVFARLHPEIAIKTSSGAFWYSGRAVWKRYWLDPASPLAQEYNIDIALRAVDAGFHEVQFDYIRFPTDGNMQDIRYPVFREARQSKGDVMEGFFKKIRTALKARNPNVMIGIDLFGEVFLYGKEHGIGQSLVETARYFDVLSPMAYPSHYRCGEFGVRDPTAHPYKVYFETLQRGLSFLNGTHVIVRPWVQDFSITSIYGCGPEVSYTIGRVSDQIRAGSTLGISGFMLWNVRSNFTVGVFAKR
jgi:hypothetical protein